MKTMKKILLILSAVISIFSIDVCSQTEKPSGTLIGDYPALDDLTSFPGKFMKLYEH